MKEYGHVIPHCGMYCRRQFLAKLFLWVIGRVGRWQVICVGGMGQNNFNLKWSG